MQRETKSFPVMQRSERMEDASLGQLKQGIMEELGGEEPVDFGPPGPGYFVSSQLVASHVQLRKESSSFQTSLVT